MVTHAERTVTPVRERLGKIPELTPKEMEDANDTPLEILYRWQKLLPGNGIPIAKAQLPFPTFFTRIIAFHGAVAHGRMDLFDPELEDYTVSQLRHDMGVCKATYWASMGGDLKNMGQLYRRTKVLDEKNRKGINPVQEKALPPGNLDSEAKTQEDVGSVVFEAPPEPVASTPAITVPAEPLNESDSFLSRYVRPINMDNLPAQPLDRRRWGAIPILTTPQFVSARSTDAERMRLLVEELPDRDDLAIDLEAVPGGPAVLFIAAVMSYRRNSFHPDTPVVTAKEFRKAAKEVAARMKSRKNMTDLAEMFHKAKVVGR